MIDNQVRILFLAPQPFFQERGTPIACRNLIQSLLRRHAAVDLLTFAEGTDVRLANLRIFRVPASPLTTGIGVGFSLKKVISDIVLLFIALRLFFQNRYDLVFGCEESVFIALLIKLLFRKPYVYDMDCLLSETLLTKFPLLRPAVPILEALEGLAVKQAEVVLPVCDSIAQAIEKHHPRSVIVLWDIPIEPPAEATAAEDLRELPLIEGRIVLYAGGFETYHGVDLLLKSFAEFLQAQKPCSLVVIGGTPDQIGKQSLLAEELGIGSSVHFLGRRPVEYLAHYMAQADFLVSPLRDKSSVPMKVFSYLASGKCILATKLPAHTQVLNDRVALLVEPTVEALSQGLRRLYDDEQLQHELGNGAKLLIESKFSLHQFEQTVDKLWFNIESWRNHSKR